MATIQRSTMIGAPAEHVWDAVRDVGAVHQRLAPGFVVGTELEDGVRVVTFASGMVVRELIVSIDEELRRLAYTAIGGRATHHHASIEVREDGEGATQLIWTTDLLPDELTEPIRQMVETGSMVMKHALEENGAARATVPSRPPGGTAPSRSTTSSPPATEGSARAT